MQLVEQHRIDRHDPRFAAIDAATFASKNLYNAALYLKRQAYIHENHRIISYTDLDKLMQPTTEYRALPCQSRPVGREASLRRLGQLLRRRGGVASPPQRSSKAIPNCPSICDKQGATCWSTPSRPSVVTQRTPAGSCHRACRFASPPKHAHAEMRRCGSFPKRPITSSKSSTNDEPEHPAA